MDTRTADEIQQLRSSPLTYAYAVDQITDVQRLRDLVIQYREAMHGQHAFAGHIIDGDCAGCERALIESDSDFACDRYSRWHNQYTAALRAV